MDRSAFAKLFSCTTDRRVLSKAVNLEQFPTPDRHSTAAIYRSPGLQAGWILIVLLMVFVSCSSSRASMYVCRDKSGAKSFTNAPGGSNCRSFAMEKLASSLVPGSGGHGPGKYDNEIRKYSRRYNVDPSLIKAIIHTESYFDHRAVSKAGAQGLMQLMPGTAKDLSVANPFNPKENIDGGTRYFRKLLDSFGNNLVLSLAAYNAGPGLVKRTGGVPKIPETERYVVKVLKQYKLYKAAW
jgi:hypothetical protein